MKKIILFYILFINLITNISAGENIKEKELNLFSFSPTGNIIDYKDGNNIELIEDWRNFKDKKKLKLICEGLEKTEVNINKVYSIYIKSLFFEEKDNKYQKMLAFEGGNLFFAREELEDQNITTKNNMKPNKHKLYKNSSIFILIIQIIAIIIGIIRLI